MTTARGRLDLTPDNRLTTLTDLTDAGLIALAERFDEVQQRYTGRASWLADAFAEHLAFGGREHVARRLDEEIGLLLIRACEDCDPDERTEAQTEMYRELAMALT